MESSIVSGKCCCGYHPSSSSPLVIVTCSADNEEREILVREGFHILTQGAEMVHYEVHNMGLRTTYANSTKILWLNPDSLRLCITKNRPPISDERLYPGVYLRDVAEVVGGDHTFAFATHPEKPNSQEQCLNIIASERTLCLQLPSEVPHNYLSFLQFRSY